MKPTSYNLKTFAQEMQDIGDTAKKQVSKQDYWHLCKIIWVNRLLFFFGFSTAWIIPNPFSMITIGLALSSTWTMVAHPVLHGGYDVIKGIPKRFHSKVFALGIRRFFDWPDWFYPPAWQYEHNKLHHFYTNEIIDLDQMSYNIHNKTSIFCKSKLKSIHFILIASTIMFWKPTYYVYTTWGALIQRKQSYQGVNLYHKQAVFTCIIPYLFMHFVLLPLPFLLINIQAFLFVLINRLGAEIISNIHSFFIIVPSHTAPDLYLQKHHFKSKEAFYVAQILSSCNYHTGGFWRDYLHGYMNYQIEHHLFPQLPLSMYPKIKPLVKSLCQKYHLPYTQESVFKRLKKLCNHSPQSAPSGRIVVNGYVISCVLLSKSNVSPGAH